MFLFLKKTYLNFKMFMMFNKKDFVFINYQFLFNYFKFFILFIYIFFLFYLFFHDHNTIVLCAAEEDQDINNIIINNYIIKENGILKRIPFEKINKNYSISNSEQIYFKNEKINDNNKKILDNYNMEKQNKGKVVLQNLLSFNITGYKILYKLNLNLNNILENKYYYQVNQNKNIYKISINPLNKIKVILENKNKEILFNNQVGINPLNKIKFILENKKILFNNQVGINPLNKIKFILENKNKEILFNGFIPKNNNIYFYKSLVFLKQNVKNFNYFLSNFNINRVNPIKNDKMVLKNLKKTLHNLIFIFFGDENQNQNKILYSSDFINGVTMYSDSFKNLSYFLPRFNFNIFNNIKYENKTIINNCLYNPYLGNLVFIIKDEQVIKYFKKENPFLKKEHIFKNFLSNYYENATKLYIDSNNLLYNLNVHLTILNKLKKENIDFNLDFQYEDYESYNESLKKFLKTDLELLELNFLDFFNKFHDSNNHDNNIFLNNLVLSEFKKYNNEILCVKEQLDCELVSLIEKYDGTFQNFDSSSSSSSNNY